MKNKQVIIQFLIIVPLCILRVLCGLIFFNHKVHKGFHEVIYFFGSTIFCVET
jgi:hypothetical protein